jgi:hypothetical protein
MKTVIYDKFLVLKHEDIHEYLSESGVRELYEMVDIINSHRCEDGKQQNKYWVCNQDEPYAEGVINLILSGEEVKRRMEK